jgi:protein-disulfide isomerase
LSSNKKRPVPKATNSKYQPRAQSSTTTYVLAAVAVVIIAAVVIGGIVWNSQRNKGGADSAVLSNSATFVVGEATAPHTIDMFEDFQCPACASVEEQSGQTVVDAVNSGQLQVRFHMLTFLNKQSGSGDYSSRAAGAMKCVADAESQDVQLAFHSKLFAVQPEEGGDDHDNQALAGFAKDVGASETTQQCIADGSAIDAAESIADESQTQLSKALDGQVGTPSVLQDGKNVPITNGTGWIESILGGSTN